MRCISPLWIRKTSMTVPCGKCNFCLSSRRAEWAFRLNQEFKKSESSSFLTLTYSDEKIPHTVNGEQELNKEHLVLFAKKLRKLQPTIPLKYYTCGEYGTKTDRPHYHSIMFNMTNETKNQVVNTWGHGHVDIGNVTGASINYVCKYVINKQNDYGDRQPPFALISKGIGKSYLSPETIAWHKSAKLDHVTANGIPARMPRYYKDVIFNKYEKEKFNKKISNAVTRYNNPNSIAYLDFIMTHLTIWSKKNDLFTNRSVIKRIN